jgi:mannose-1-phosphate guanylyltransferase
MIVPVILSGGSGTRLWPLSREAYPKQFLPLGGPDTMLQNTALRIAGLADVAAPLVVCNQEHRFMVAEQMRSAAYAAGGGDSGAGRPQHRAGGRGRGPARPAPAAAIRCC